MVEKGIVYGRFQMLHLKHIEYILAAKMRCQKLFIGIVSPDSSCWKERSTEEDVVPEADKEKKGQCGREENPLTYLERYEMIRDALISFGVPREEFEIVPFPLEKPECLKEYVPAGAVCFLSLCDSRTRETAKKLEGYGFQTEVLWERLEEEKGITAGEIRRMIREREDVSAFIPRTAAEYMEKEGITERIRKEAEKKSQEV